MDQDLKEITDTANRKRPRDDSECDSPVCKLIRVDSVNSYGASTDLVVNQPGWDNSGADNSGVNSPEAKRIQDDLLNILDESDDPIIQGLDSVIRSFEEEILVAVSGPETVDVTVDGNRSQPELGYLLEASDDELGLPPTFSGEEDKISAVDLDPETSRSGGTDFGEMLGFQDEIPSYDSFEYGFAGDSVSNSCNGGSYNDGGDFVTLGGLFDYSDDNYLPCDESGVQLLPESLSAL